MTQLRLQDFDIRLENKPRVRTPFRRNLLPIHYSFLGGACSDTCNKIIAVPGLKPLTVYEFILSPTSMSSYCLRTAFRTSAPPLPLSRFGLWENLPLFSLPRFGFCANLTLRMYPRPVDKDAEVFQLKVTKVEATAMGNIWMCSDWKKRIHD